MNATETAQGTEPAIEQAREFVIISTAVVWAFILSWTTPAVRIISGHFADVSNAKSIGMFAPLCLWVMLYLGRFMFFKGGGVSMFLGPKMAGIIGCVVCGFQTIISGGILRSPLISGIGIVVLLATSIAKQRTDREALYICGSLVIVTVAILSFYFNDELSYASQNGLLVGYVFAFAAIPIVGLLTDRAVNSGEKAGSSVSKS